MNKRPSKELIYTACKYSISTTIIFVVTMELVELEDLISKMIIPIFIFTFFCSVILYMIQRLPFNSKRDLYSKILIEKGEEDNFKITPKMITQDICFIVFILLLFTIYIMVNK